MNEEEAAAQTERRRILRERLAATRVTGVELAAAIGIAPEHLSRLLSEDEPDVITAHRLGSALRAIAVLAAARGCCHGHGDEQDQESTLED